MRKREIFEGEVAVGMAVELDTATELGFNGDGAVEGASGLLVLAGTRVVRARERNEVC